MSLALLSALFAVGTCGAVVMLLLLIHNLHRRLDLLTEIVRIERKRHAP